MSSQTPSTAPDAKNTESAPPATLLRHKKRRNLLLAGLLLLLAGAGWFWFQEEDQGPQAEPLIATVSIGTIENTITAAGSLQPRHVVDVGAQVSGQLQELYVEVGDLVEEGQLLAEIDARVQQNRVDASRASIEAQEAQLASRQASLELARANARRQERLREASATSEVDYETAMTTLKAEEFSLLQLEKQIEQSRSSLQSEETQLEFTRIYAPTSGTVVSIEMNEGRTLNAAQQAPTILRIADLSTMTVETEISEADIGRVKKGMPVYFTTLGAGSRRWYGSLRQILPTPLVENNVVLYTGLFDVENTDGNLLPEMTAQVYFITSSAEDVLTVPLGALTFHDAADEGRGLPASFPGDPEATPPGPPTAGKQGAPARTRSASGNQSGRRLATVQIIDSTNAIKEREVMVGVTSRVAAEVVSGLQVGDQVVAGILQAGADGGSGNGRSGGFSRRGPF